jgi:hypothetical protein
MENTTDKRPSMTSAERQRAYRERHAEAAKRINMLVSVSSKRALERLARHRGQTQRAVLEDVLGAAERAVLDVFENTSAYYDGVQEHQ